MKKYCYATIITLMQLTVFYFKFKNIGTANFKKYTIQIMSVACKLIINLSKSIVMYFYRFL